MQSFLRQCFFRLHQIAFFRFADLKLLLAGQITVIIIVIRFLNHGKDEIMQKMKYSIRFGSESIAPAALK